MASSEAGLTPFGNALSGALGGVLSNAIVYPLDTVKTRLQAEAKSAAESAPPLPSPQIKRENAPARLPARKMGSRQMIRRILRENGVEGFYRGFLASMLNTFSMQLYVQLVHPGRPRTDRGGLDAAPTFTGTASSEEHTSSGYTKAPPKWAPRAPCPSLSRPRVRADSGPSGPN